MKKIFMICTAALMMCSISSCIGDEDFENTYSHQDYYTFTGDLEQGYTLYSDHGTFIKLDKSAFEPGKSFGKTERALVLAQYKENMISTEGNGLTNPTIIGYMELPTADPISIEEAMDRKITEADSCSSVAKLELWAYRGYLNAMTTATYGKSAPVLNLVYNPAMVKSDTITLNLCYNIHKQPLTGSGNYYTSFRLDKIDEIVPGSGTVVITVKCNGTEDTNLKVSRKNLHKGNWLQKD